MDLIHSCKTLSAGCQSLSKLHRRWCLRCSFEAAARVSLHHRGVKVFMSTSLRLDQETDIHTNVQLDFAIPVLTPLDVLPVSRGLLLNQSLLWENWAAVFKSTSYSFHVKTDEKLWIIMNSRKQAPPYFRCYPREGAECLTWLYFDYWNLEIWNDTSECPFHTSAHLKMLIFLVVS